MNGIEHVSVVLFLFIVVLLVFRNGIWPLLRDRAIFQDLMDTFNQEDTPLQTETRIPETQPPTKPMQN